MAIDSFESLFETTSELIGEEQYLLATDHGDKGPISYFDNYKWCSPFLAHFSYFEYCMLVQVKNKDDARTSNVKFNDKHPNSDTQI